MFKTLAPDEIFLEKTPSHALFIPEIKEVLPNARIIHLLRDPRDVVASLLAASRGWGSNWAPRGAGAAVQIWVEHFTAVSQAAKFLSSDEFCEITYEDLWQTPLDVLTRVAKFLRIKWPREAISQSIEANVPAAMVSAGTPIPLFGEAAKRNGGVAKLPDGFVRRARPGSWKTDLSIREKIRVFRVATDRMKQAGYRWNLADWL